jgi:hypothetical protein
MDLNQNGNRQQNHSRDGVRRTWVCLRRKWVGELLGLWEELFWSELTYL